MLIQRLRLPPLVISNEQRDAYFDALARADDGSLSGLANLFLELASATMLRELEPREFADETNALSVARSISLTIAARKLAGREYVALNQRNFEQLTWFTERMLEPWFAAKQAALLEALAHEDVSSSIEVKVLPPIIDQPLTDPWIETHIVGPAQRSNQAYEVRSCVGAVQMKIKVEDDWMIVGASTYRLSPGSNVLVAVPFASEVETTERIWYSAHDTHSELDARTSELDVVLTTCLGRALEAFKRRIAPTPQ